MEQEEIVYVLIDGSINLLWKINLTNVLVATKKEIGKLNNIMLPFKSLQKKYWTAFLRNR